MPTCCPHGICVFERLEGRDDAMVPRSARSQHVRDRRSGDGAYRASVRARRRNPSRAPFASRAAPRRAPAMGSCGCGMDARGAHREAVAKLDREPRTDVPSMSCISVGRSSRRGRGPRASRASACLSVAVAVAHRSPSLLKLNLEMEMEEEVRGLR